MNAPQSLPENDDPINREALRLLKLAKQSPDPYSLYVLQLIAWGFESGIEIPGPLNRYRWELHESLPQLYSLHLKPAQVMRWLVSNPNGPSAKEQRDTLLSLLEASDDPESAASDLLEWYADRKAASDPYYSLAESRTPGLDD